MKEGGITTHLQSQHTFTAMNLRSMEVFAGTIKSGVTERVKLDFDYFAMACKSMAQRKFLAQHLTRKLSKTLTSVRCVNVGNQAIRLKLASVLVVEMAISYSFTT